MCKNCGRPKNTTYTNAVGVVAAPDRRPEHSGTLQAAVEKVAEVQAFTSYLLPAQFDYEYVRQALNVLIKELGGFDAVP